MQKSKKREYLWWLVNEKGEIGSFKSKLSALQAIKKLGFSNWHLEKHIIANCPFCNGKAEKDIIKEIGMCLNCDHIFAE